MDQTIFELALQGIFGARTGDPDAALSALEAIYAHIINENEAEYEAWLAKNNLTSN